MLRLGHLAKVQGLKGELLLHAETDAPERLPELQGLILAPPEDDYSGSAEAPAGAVKVTVRQFRWHQDRPCLAFAEYPDRTAAESIKGWALWMPDSEAHLGAGETFRHDWVGCDVFVTGEKVGEVLRLESTPGGYDMVILRDARPGRRGQRQVPYVKAWFTLDLPARRIDLDPPEGLLDLDRV